MYKVSMRYVSGVCGGMDWGMEEGIGMGVGERFTFKPLIPPLISSAAFSPWAPVGLLVVVGVDMVVIKVQVLLFRGLGGLGL